MSQLVFLSQEIGIKVRRQRALREDESSGLIYCSDQIRKPDCNYVKDVVRLVSPVAEKLDCLSSMNLVPTRLHVFCVWLSISALYL